MGFFDSIFSEEKRIMKKYEQKANEVVALESKFAAMSDDELKAKTAEFKERLQKGRSEMKLKSNYEYVVVNRRVEDAAREIASIIRARMK